MNLSIVIPVYNIEKYIGDCLQSVFSQELDDFEVVCVNDGSTDNSQVVIDGFVGRYHNIQCVRQSNQGLSAARNTGINKATGKYIFFLDGDDVLRDNHSLAHALKVCFQNNLDLFVGNAIVDGHSAYLSNYPKNDKVMSGFQMMHMFMCNNRTLIEPVWCYIYCKELLAVNHLFFKKNIYHEDILFTPQAMYYAERCICKDIAIVNYQTHRAGAITSMTSNKHLIDKRDTARNLYAFFLSKSVLDSVTERIVFEIYLDIIKSAYDNCLSATDIIMPEDRNIINRCTQTKQERKMAHLLLFSPALSARYSSNTLHPLIRRAINFLPL